MAHDEAADLAAFIERISPVSHARVERDLGRGFVRLRVSEAEKRQAKQDVRCVEDAVIELLRNARDAGAHEIFVATSRCGNERRITVLDDGAGIPSEMFESVFEPRVTSKLDTCLYDDWGIHGRGMALFSIRQNAKIARIADSVEGGGASFQVVFDTKALVERRDQSTQPFLTQGENGEETVGSGPRNIARSIAEFALASAPSCTVYFGTAIEVAATLYSRRQSQGFETSLLSTAADANERDRAPLLTRLMQCFDAAQIVSCSADMGLDVSQRSAYRILDGSIEPLAPYLSTLERRSFSSRKAPSSSRDCARDHRGLKIARDDMEDFEMALHAAWETLAHRYFLEADIRPDIRVSRDGVCVRFPVRKQL